MRALTVRQPWAAAIIHWGKSPENRTRNLAGSYRGPVAIHAGLVEDDAAYDDEMIRQALGENDDGWVLAEQVGAAGAFVGVADLVDVHWSIECCDIRGRMCSPWAQASYHVDGLVRRRVNIAHLVLANPRPLEVPIPARGMLGLWTPEPEHVAQLQAVTR